MNRLENKIALITGGANGIGAATAQRFLAEGAHVIIGDLPRTPPAPISPLLHCDYAHLDVTQEESWHTVVADIAQRFGRIDILVNAAGIVGDVVNGSLDKMSLEDWRRVMSVNLDGTFLGCREVMREMRKQGTGSIINLSSVGGYYPTTQNAAYGASKGAVTQLSKTVALFGSQGGKRVRCNSVHPGQIATQMLHSIREQRQMRGSAADPAQQPSSVQRIPLGEGTPDDVAYLITFLASDEAHYVTGAEFTVDGGWRLLR